MGGLCEDPIQLPLLCVDRIVDGPDLGCVSFADLLLCGLNLPQSAVGQKHHDGDGQAHRESDQIKKH